MTVIATILSSIIRSFSLLHQAPSVLRFFANWKKWNQFHDKNGGWFLLNGLEISLWDKLTNRFKGPKRLLRWCGRSIIWIVDSFIHFGSIIWTGTSLLIKWQLVSSKRIGNFYCVINSLIDLTDPNERYDDEAVQNWQGLSRTYDGCNGSGWVLQRLGHLLLDCNKLNDGYVNVAVAGTGSGRTGPRFAVLPVDGQQFIVAHTLRSAVHVGHVGHAGHAGVDVTTKQWPPSPSSLVGNHLQSDSFIDWFSAVQWVHTFIRIAKSIQQLPLVIYFY